MYNQRFTFAGNFSMLSCRKTDKKCLICSLMLAFLIMAGRQSGGMQQRSLSHKQTFFDLEEKNGKKNVRDERKRKVSKTQGMRAACHVAESH